MIEDRRPEQNKQLQGRSRISSMNQISRDVGEPSWSRKVRLVSHVTMCFDTHHLISVASHAPEGRVIGR